jgi:hypothetical protein
MSTSHINAFRPHNAKNQHRPLSAALLAASIAVAAACGLTVLAPVAWTAAKDALQAEPSTVAQCEMIVAGTDRLACFDRLGKLALQPPAKGALAPAFAH